MKENSNLTSALIIILGAGRRFSLRPRLSDAPLVFAFPDSLQLFYLPLDFEDESFPPRSNLQVAAATVDRVELDEQLCERLVKAVERGVVRRVVQLGRIRLKGQVSREDEGFPKLREASGRRVELCERDESRVGRGTRSLLSRGRGLCRARTSTRRSRGAAAALARA